MPLFCACSGGGDISEYRDFASALSMDQPVYVFGLPVSMKETQFPSVERLAAIYVRKVRELQEQGPYQLCGFSFGGLVAYEMAIQMAAQGQEVGILALIDTLHPRFTQSLSTRQRAIFLRTYFSSRLAKYGRNILNMRFDKLAYDILRFAGGRKKELISKIFGSLFSEKGRRLPDKMLTDELVLAAAWHRYIPASYSGRLLLLKALQRQPEYGNDQTLGWKACSTGAIAVRTVPGDHTTIMRPPYVRSLVEQVKPYLDAATASLTHRVV